MSNTRLTEVYVALRELLRARFVSPQTRQQAVRAIDELRKEALIEAVLDKHIEDKAA